MILTSKRKRWLDSPPDFYPEIGFERTLGRVILDLIAESGRDIMLISQSENVSSVLSQGRRFADMGLAGGERLFMASFSLRGVTLASFQTTDLREFAKAVELWLLDELALREMKERLCNFQVSDDAFEIERANGVTVRWNLLRSDTFGLHPEFRALIDAASERPLLRQLFPVVSIGQFLGFSRTIGYPFAGAGGHIAWIGSGRYKAFGPDRDVLEKILWKKCWIYLNELYLRILALLFMALRTICNASTSGTEVREVKVYHPQK